MLSVKTFCSITYNEFLVNTTELISMLSIFSFAVRVALMNMET